MSTHPASTAGLDVSTVVAAALAIADADGLAAVSMRRVAAELGVTPMALYHHVAGKERLIDLMADRSLQTLRPVDPEAAWDDELRRFFTGLYELCVAHPAVTQVMTQRPLEGPAAARLGDALLALLTASGFTDEDAVTAFVALFNYTIGASLYRLTRGRPDHGRLNELSPEDTPTAHRLRATLARAADADAFSAALIRMIDGYRADAAAGRRVPAC
jgi:AcrR family transcriptional regulator